MSLLHGGKLSVESMGLGHGCTFSLDLPICAPRNRFPSNNSLRSSISMSMTNKQIQSPPYGPPQHRLSTGSGVGGDLPRRTAAVAPDMSTGTGGASLPIGRLSLSRSFTGSENDCGAIVRAGSYVLGGSEMDNNMNIRAASRRIAVGDDNDDCESVWEINDMNCDDVDVIGTMPDNDQQLQFGSFQPQHPELTRKASFRPKPTATADDSSSSGTNGNGNTVDQKARVHKRGMSMSFLTSIQEEQNRANQQQREREQSDIDDNIPSVNTTSGVAGGTAAAAAGNISNTAGNKSFCLNPTSSSLLSSSSKLLNAFVFVP
eukprot:gene8085-16591_t